MHTDIGSFRLEDDCPQRISHIGLTCDECGKKFQKPILARVSAGGNVKTYQACPHCMTKVPGFAMPKGEERKLIAPPKGLGEPSAPSESSSKCGHFFGYLNKREKGASFPEACLICAKMVECLHG